MKNKPSAFFIIFTFGALAFYCLPWFSFNAKVARPYWGVNALYLVALPYLCIFLNVSGKWKGTASVLCTEVSLLCIPALLTHVFFTWTNTMNISRTASLDTSLAAAKLPFWIVSALALLSLVSYQLNLLKHAER